MKRAVSLIWGGMVLVVCLHELAWPQGSAGQALQRVPNETLRMPLAPPTLGFSTENAFPDILFDGPLKMTFPPGETNRLFIVERPGRIQVITNLAAPNKTLFLDISSRVNTEGEGGLLGLAFHPGYVTNRAFFVFYTLDTTTAAGSGFHDRLARFETSPDNPNLALPDSEIPLINQYDPDSNHNGGDVVFGRDGYLYVSLGDGGGGGDPYQNSQRIDRDFFSGILRIDVDQRPGNLPPNAHPAASAAYAVPADNPFVGATEFNDITVEPGNVRTEFWAVGFRNPWRMSFDDITGFLYCGDVGQSTREEIDVVTKGGNYGWNYREGTGTFRAAPADLQFIEPILDYVHPGYGETSEVRGTCVIGGIVYRGAALPKLEGHYVFGDFESGGIWAVRYDGTAVSGLEYLTFVDRPTAFGYDPSNGGLLIASGGGGDIRRLVYDGSNGGTPIPSTLADTGAFADLETLTPQPGVVPYDLNVPFWSDHARKTRWFSVPDANLTIGFSPTNNWSFPTGTVWIKHFDLELTNGLPESSRRLETRFLVRGENGIYGVSYRWGDTTANAVLVPDQGLDEEFIIHDGGTTRTQRWHYPARSECVACHSHVGGLALGFNTPQLNRRVEYSGTVADQLLALSQAGYLDASLQNTETLPTLASATNGAYSVEHRARSYLQANCAQCHQPGGAAQGFWDARIATPLDNAGIINGPLANQFANPSNRVIRPGALEHSMILTRISQLGPNHMPPLATSELNDEAIGLLSNWITNALSATSLGFVPGGMVQLQFAGVPGRTYRIEASSDLLSWQTVASVPASPLGLVEHAESSSGTRFYRVAWP